jgi:5-methylcytosine-specific restriction protein A
MARTYDHNWQRVRLVVLARDGHRCQLNRPGCTGVATQVDHIVPISEGGERLDSHNLRASCRHCNTSRGASRHSEFVAAFRRMHETA